MNKALATMSKALSAGDKEVGKKDKALLVIMNKCTGYYVQGTR